MKKIMLKVRAPVVEQNMPDVEETLLKIDGLSIQNGDFKAGNVIIAFDPEIVDEDTIIGTVLEHGYVIDYFLQGGLEREDGYGNR